MIGLLGILLRLAFGLFLTLLHYELALRCSYTWHNFQHKYLEPNYHVYGLCHTVLLHSLIIARNMQFQSSHLHVLPSVNIPYDTDKRFQLYYLLYLEYKHLPYLSACYLGTFASLTDEYDISNMKTWMSQPETFLLSRLKRIYTKYPHGYNPTFYELLTLYGNRIHVHLLSTLRLSYLDIHLP